VGVVTVREFSDNEQSEGQTGKERTEEAWENT
jgi:hypothetical protein